MIIRVSIQNSRFKCILYHFTFNTLSLGLITYTGCWTYHFHYTFMAVLLVRLEKELLAIPKDYIAPNAIRVI